VPAKSGIFTNRPITVWGELGTVILQVSIAVFIGRCRKIFSGNMAQPPRKNWPVRLWCPSHQILATPLDDDDDDDDDDDISCDRRTTSNK